MNGTVSLERAIQQVATQTTMGKLVLVAAWRAGSAEVGGLELSVVRVGPSGFLLGFDTYKIICVQRGRAKIQLGGSEVELKAHASNSRRRVW